MEQRDQKSSFIRGLSSSLAFRIFIIETVLLVLPLLFFSGLMYFEDTRLQAKDNLFTLDLILYGKQELIREVMDSERDFLSYVQDLKPDQKLLKQLVKRDKASALFHLVKGKEGYVCDQASAIGLIGQDFSELIPKTLTPSGALIGNPDTDFFYFFHPFSNGQEIWGSSFSAKRLTDKIKVEKNSSDRAVISLLSQNGTVLLSTQETWNQWQLPKALKSEQFLFIGEKYIGKLETIEHSNLLILVAALKKVNFVDIPYFFAKMSGLLLLILVVGGGATLWLTFRLGKPLKSLCSAMERVKSEDLSARYAPDRMGFEINVVGMIFNSMIDSLMTFIEKVKQERAAKEAFERELMIGQEVQTSILPKKVPSFPGLDIAARFVSAKEVGGDFYDFLVLPGEEGDRLFFAIADTAGKGIYACLYSLSVRSMLRCYGEMYDDLGQILQETNNLFCLDTGDTGVFVTAWGAFFDEKTKKLFFSNCGHFPALLVRENGEIEKLTTPGMALGVERFDQVSTDSVELHSGDSLLLFTDGVVEAHNEKMAMFGEGRLMEAFVKRRHLPSKQIVDEIIEEVAFFAEGAPQHDDLTLLILKIS